MHQAHECCAVQPSVCLIHACCLPNHQYRSHPPQRARHRNPAATEHITNLVQHTSGSFLRNSQIPVQFHRRHALFAGHQKINGNRPLLQWHRGVLQQRAVAKQKMPATVSTLARQWFATWNFVGVGTAATVTPCNTGLPDDRLKPLACRGFIGNHLYQLEQRNTVAMRLAGDFSVRRHLDCSIG